MQITTNNYMPHERLIVYTKALAFQRAVYPLARQRGLSNLRDQLMRASESVVLNIAEGAGRTARNDKRRYYEIAKGSIAECSAVLDLLRGRNAIRESEYRYCRNLAIEITLMLRALAGPPR